ncbi:MAG TPA: response regulator [Verrucomicrobiae bacterium]|jgi:DNA-binding response OmpR family regulator|nr:response regulator [Verrucomicrobiae bacterium]
MKKQILVIDDDRTFSMLIEEILSQKGYGVSVETDGVHGLKRAQTEHPDLIIVDVLMPAMTGYDFVQAVRKSDSALRIVPIIVVSSRKTMKEYFKSWEVAFFLSKPFHPNELVSKVEFALLGPETVVPDDQGGIKFVETKEKKALWVGYDDVIHASVSKDLAALGYRVYSAHREDKGLEEAIQVHPDVIVCQFHKIKGILNATKFYQDIQGRDALKDVPFVLVCPADMEGDAKKVFTEAEIARFSDFVPYTSSHDVHKRLTKLISNKFVRQP